jgi:hypothetical protein
MASPVGITKAERYPEVVRQTVRRGLLGVAIAASATAGRPPETRRSDSRKFQHAARYR